MATFPLHLRHIAEMAMSQKIQAQLDRDLAAYAQIDDVQARSRTIMQLMNRDGDRCYLCGRTALRYEIEHVVARANGGSNDLRNLALACHSCNARKGTRVIAFRISDRIPYLMEI